MKFFRHENALVESKNIGENTQIWAFSHVLPGAVIGADCNINDYVFIENDVRIGDRVTVKSGVQIWDGIRIEDDVFIGPNATFTNDPFPRSKQHLDSYPETFVRQGASIGANASILPGLTIGRGAMVGAGAVVTRDVHPFTVVAGNPARIQRYIDADRSQRRSPLPSPAAATSDVAGVTVIESPLTHDMRGNLIAREVGDGIPFEPRRVFVVFDVPSREVRGAHAHRSCHQLLVCLRGSVSCAWDDGTSRQEQVFDSPEQGLYIPPMIWAAQYRYSEDAILMVIASHPYDPGDYIRDYDEFIREKRASGADS